MKVSGLKGYIKPYWKFVILGPLFMLFEVFFDLLQPRLAAYIVNNGVVERDFNVIEHTGILMFLVAFLSLIAGVGCNIFASRASQNIGGDIRADLYKKVQTFSFQDIDKFKSGSLITRMTNDVVQVQTLVQVALQGLVRAPCLLIGSVIMSLLMNLRLGLILLGTLVVLIGVLIVLMRFSYPLFSKVQQKLDMVNTRIQENLAGIRVVKAFVRSSYETNRFQKVNRDYTQSSIKASRFIALNSPIMTLIMNICLVGILLYSGPLVWRDSFKVGDLVAFVNYVVQALSSLIMVSGRLMDVSRANVSAQRIQEVLSTEPSIVDAKSEKKSLLLGEHISFKHVNFSYNNSKTGEDSILRDINFEASRGETVAIIGSTGAGKSTLVQLIPRLYDVTSGSVVIDGRDIRNIPLAELRHNIGMVLQDSFLFTGSIRDNISLGKVDAKEEDIIEVAKIAQVHDFISKLPHGYDTKVGQKGVNLSGGQKQRISIARTLLIKPSILIMDDSTSALDSETERKLRDALKGLIKNNITFIIAQRISSCIDAEKILVMDEGTIVGSGTHQELLESCGVYQDIYRSQFGEREVSYEHK
ncbi:ABC transporter ATP-binding protein [Priestia filamentosa]|uniref:Multidrug ABC transporter ATP-binding protein n=2 Tax=Priestia filamentosa TaxID=1402861 RepID=A0A0H4KHG0_9BACI|nr:ABC transporter ATP-binding protein [Priestia filamentosa]AKO92236.1 multidrug ABC transporter ATP-binding protein [Priestia filamentosa]MDT3762264.1 ABC transporter ATP-binding protein [Priestia filamentosa]OXS68832.1 multidrug ABC transporter ATP-binding protein [Priestia filamentosa]WCM17344.1 ABC transporter ATP-binding protein [Priestia filamentosa]WRU96751.1 ABC transporter ATP-binding protein [Priestia filamentosa]